MKVVKIAFVITAIVVILVVFLRVFSGEDTWICQNGDWVMHGKPSSLKPKDACPGHIIRKEVSMKLTSTVFFDKQPIPVDFSCKGTGLRPTLQISDAPKGIKSLAITMDDPDAPMGTFHHWVIWNIPVTTKEIGTILPSGSVEGKNGAGKIGYVPPCPPSGTHRYIFTLYALNVALQLLPSADTKTFQSAIAGHITEQTTLTGTFSK